LLLDYVLCFCIRFVYLSFILDSVLVNMYSLNVHIVTPLLHSYCVFLILDNDHAGTSHQWKVSCVWWLLLNFKFTLNITIKMTLTMYYCMPEMVIRQYNLIQRMCITSHAPSLTAILLHLVRNTSRADYARNQTRATSIIYI